MRLDKISNLSTVIFLSLTFFFAEGPVTALISDLQPSAEAGFFNNDLESFEDVLLLISRNYVYAPDYQKLFTSALQNIATTVDSRDASIKINEKGEISVKAGNKLLQYQLVADMDRNFQTFKEIFYWLADLGSGSPSKKALETAGIEGMMNALDPYSQYLDEKSFSRSMRDTEGQYGGLGMVITMKDYQLVVVKTMKNSPAKRKGILQGDIILNVNSKPVKGMQIDQLATLLRGYPNTKVSLTIFRPDTGKHLVHTLTREIISVETVEYRKVGGETGYLKISSFSKQTNNQLKEALKKLREENIKGLILDLRNNPGGLLDQSVKVASHFLNQGKLIVFTQGREFKDRDEYRALYSNNLMSIPLAILINHQSASASEIVAGALRDSGRGLIVGQTSYGKGSVQTIFKIRENAGIRLTTSKYFTPSGIDITEQGISPEIIIWDDVVSASESMNEMLGQDQINQDSPISLKRSAVEKFLKKNGLTVTQENDPALLLLHMILKRSTGTNNKKLAIDQARELAANIPY
tara:strand:+ start:210 stop:1778 length:1569 start_codon:yes stop_codon:yes gene_type:complete